MLNPFEVTYCPTLSIILDISVKYYLYFLACVANYLYICNTENKLTVLTNIRNN